MNFDKIKIDELDIDTEYRKDDEDFNETYQKFCISVIDNDNETAEKIKKQILENQNKAAENQKLKEDAELDQYIDWGDDGQRFCPTHKKSYHLYCKECKLEIKQLKEERGLLKSAYLDLDKEFTNLKSQLEQYKAVIDEVTKLAEEPHLDYDGFYIQDKLKSALKNLGDSKN